MLGTEVRMLPEMILAASLLNPSMGTASQESSKSEAPSPAAAKPTEPPKHHLIPAEKEGGLPTDSKDHQPVLLGATTREAILTHRDVFREAMQNREIPGGLAARWKAVDTPCTLVVAFGSWCSDSQHELPDFLALTKDPNPFVTIRYLGVYRDKKTEPGAWPKGIAPQAIEKVPTFWLFELQPDGSQKLLGSIVETPPKPGQRMAEAVLELLAKAR